MANVWGIIITLIIVLIGCPILGKFLYKRENKVVFLIYAIISILITLLTYFFTIHASTAEIGENITLYFTEIIHFKWLYILSFLTYILSGVGIIGGVLEYIGEKTESADAYKKYDKFAFLKLYMNFIVYGYVFLFAVFALSQFLAIFLQWEYSNPLFVSILDYILFHNIFLTIIGTLLYSIKTFRFGLFSIEFYRSEFHPSVTNIGPKLKGFRRFFAIFIGTIGIYVSSMVYFLEKYPNTVGENVTFGRSFFFLFATIQAILFYSLKDRFVDQLKPISKQYELKVGSGPLTKEQKDETLKDSEEELRFDD